MTETENNIWTDIRRYEWNWGSPFYDLDEISKIISGLLGGLEVSMIPVRYDINLGFYVIPESIGVEITLQEYPHSNFVRSMATGKDKKKVTTVQETLEKIIKDRGYNTYASYAANPNNDTYDFLGKAYGALNGLGIRH